MSRSRPSTEQADSPAQIVTAAAPLTAAERKRRQRERERNASALFYQRDDWQLFCDIATLPQKAGCQPRDIISIALKELVDNSLDHCPDGEVTLDHEGDWWVISTKTHTSPTGQK
jgi:signal transduction histidine kinase